MSKLRSLSLGFSLLAAPALAESRPAVRMLPAKPMGPVDAITARAASDNGFNPFPTTPRDTPSNRYQFSPLADDRPAGDSNWKKFTKWVDERTKAVKNAVSGPPQPQPEPRVGMTDNSRRLFEPRKPAQPEQPRVNYARPAFGWYGWGSSTPGLNPYAPAGDYPNASAQWYAESGATPGAFPAPTMNPYRPAPGVAPPAYAPPAYAPSSITPPPVSAPSVTVSPPVTPAPRTVPVIPPPRTIAETPMSAAPAMPPVAPAMPPVFAPSNQIPVTKPVESNWKPAADETPKAIETPGLIIPIIRGAAPDIVDSPLARQIHGACRGLVTNVVIRETGPAQLTVAFDATTATLAEIAVRATSDIIELKPYEINFAANVKQP